MTPLHVLGVVFTSLLLALLRGAWLLRVCCSRRGAITQFSLLKNHAREEPAWVLPAKLALKQSRRRTKSFTSVDGVILLCIIAYRRWSRCLQTKRGYTIRVNKAAARLQKKKFCLSQREEFDKRVWPCSNRQISCKAEQRGDKKKGKAHRLWIIGNCCESLDTKKSFSSRSVAKETTLGFVVTAESPRKRRMEMTDCKHNETHLFHRCWK